VGGLELSLSEENPDAILIKINKKEIGAIVSVSNKKLSSFDIKQAVYFVDIDFNLLLQLVMQRKITYKEVNKFPAMQRDLALVVDKKISFDAIDLQVRKTQLSKLKQVRLFDIFMSDKLGADKKSMAISFTFEDDQKTLTDIEVDTMVGKLIHQFEKELGAEIRK